LSSLKEALKYRAYNQYRSKDVRTISHESGMVLEDQVITDKNRL